MLQDVLNNSSLKAKEKREQLINQLKEEELSIAAIEKASSEFSDKQLVIVLEAIEELTGKMKGELEIDYLLFAQKYIIAEHNSLKREASRIVGNMAAAFPEQAAEAVSDLIVNSASESTVVRWGSAYALSRILLSGERYRSDLYEQLEIMSTAEQENGVKNQYIKALKKAQKLRG